MKLYGGLTPWCGVGGTLPIELPVQRTMRITETWALFMLIGLSEICSDNSSVEQTIKNDEVNSVMANHNDADLWIHGWDGVQIVFSRNVFALRWHESTRKQLAGESKQIALASDTAPELSQSQANKDGAEYAEQVTLDALRERTCSCRDQVCCLFPV